MSTTYYELKEPWSAINVRKIGDSHRIFLWIGGFDEENFSGELAVGEEDLELAMDAFMGNEIAVRVGIGEGRTSLYIYKDPESRQVISEYGDVINSDHLYGIADVVENRSV